MATNGLADLSCDFWRNVDVLLSYTDVGCLLMTGCRRLVDKIRYSVSFVAYNPGLCRQYCLPSYISSLCNLQVLVVSLPLSKSLPGWRTFDSDSLSKVAKTLKSLTLVWECVSDSYLPRECFSASHLFSLALTFPHLTSLSVENTSLCIPQFSNDPMLSVLALPLTCLRLPISTHVSLTHLSLLNPFLLELSVSLARDFSDPNPLILFPPHLTKLSVRNLPISFPFAQFPRSILDLDIAIATVVELNALKDWPPHLEKLCLFFAGVMDDTIRLTFSVARSLPRTLTHLDWCIPYFESAKIISEMPPHLVKCSTQLAGLESITEAIPLLSKSLCSIHANYLSFPTHWKSLPRSVTCIGNGVGLAHNFNYSSSGYVQDLPPLLSSLECHTSFFQSYWMLSNITHLSVPTATTRLHDEWRRFFDLISICLPQLESLEIGRGDLIDGILVDILQQPLKTLKVSCDPCKLNFFGKWCARLEVLEIRPASSNLLAYMKTDSLARHDSNWRLPATLTTLVLDRPLVFLSPSSAEHWPPNLANITLCDLNLQDTVTLWTSLPRSLKTFEVKIKSGNTNLLDDFTFIESLAMLPKQIVAFWLDHVLYKPFVKHRLFRNRKGEFCFPQCILDLPKTRPRLALLRINMYEVDMNNSAHTDVTSSGAQ